MTFSDRSSENYFRYPLIACFALVLVSGWGAVSQAAVVNDEPYPITLEEAVTLSVRNNFKVALKRLELLNAGAQKIVAESAFDPSLSASATLGGSRTPSSSAFADPAIGESQSQDAQVAIARKSHTGSEYTLSAQALRESTNSSFSSLDPTYNTVVKLSLTKPLWKGAGRNVNRWQIVTSANSEISSKESLRQSISNVVTDVNGTYWELVYRKDALAAEKESLAIARDFERRVRIQVEVGALAQIEILVAQASVADRERLVIEAANTLEETSDRLLSLINPSLGSDIWKRLLNPVDEPVINAEKVDLDLAVSRALRDRPEVAMASMELENRETELVYYRNGEKPELDFIAVMSLNGLRGDVRNATSLAGGVADSSDLEGGLFDSYLDAGSGDYYQYSFGVTLSFPLGNREAKATSLGASLAVQTAVINLENAKREVAMEVRDAIRSIENGRKQLAASEFSRNLAEKRLEAELSKFEAGASTSFRVLEYQKDMTVQKNNELSAIANLRKAVAQYHYSIGRTLDFFGISVD